MFKLLGKKIIAFYTKNLLNWALGLLLNRTDQYHESSGNVNVNFKHRVQLA